MFEYGVMHFNVIEIIPVEGFEMFNFGFTVMCVFGLMSFSITILVKIISRS